jgi:hypothetical protein
MYGAFLLITNFYLLLVITFTQYESNWYWRFRTPFMGLSLLAYTWIKTATGLVASSIAWYGWCTHNAVSPLSLLYLSGTVDFLLSIVGCVTIYMASDNIQSEVTSTYRTFFALITIGHGFTTICSPCFLYYVREGYRKYLKRKAVKDSEEFSDVFHAADVKEKLKKEDRASRKRKGRKQKDQSASPVTATHDTHQASFQLTKNTTFISQTEFHKLWAHSPPSGNFETRIRAIPPIRDVIYHFQSCGFQILSCGKTDKLSDQILFYSFGSLPGFASGWFLGSIEVNPYNYSISATFKSQYVELTPNFVNRLSLQNIFTLS